MSTKSESFISNVKGNKISGIALIPRISRNNNLYTKGEMENADGVRVHLDWEHDVSQIIGEVTFHYDRENEQVLYEGIITEPWALERIRGKDIYTSIEVNARHEQKICNSGKIHDCMKMLTGVEFVGLALTETPGIPETTIQVSEHMRKKQTNDDKPYILPSHTCGMAERTVKEAKEAETPTSGVDQQKPPEEVPMDKKVLDGTIVPADNTEMGNGNGDDKDKDKEADMDDDDDMKKDKEMGNGHGDKDKEESKSVGQPRFLSASQLEDFAKKIEASVEKKFEQKMKGISENTDTKIKTFAEDLTKPNLIKLAPSNMESLQAEGYRMRDTLKRTGYYATDIDIGTSEQILESYGGYSKRYSEAVAHTGDPSNKIAVTSRLRVLPNANYARSIRDLVQFYEIPQGADEAKMSYITPPAIQTFTEGTETAATTHTNVTIALSADVVNGNSNNIAASFIEDTPQELLPALAEAARISMLDSEATLIFDTTAQAISASNLGRWINANDGTALSTADNGITAPVAGTSEGDTFDHKGLAAALRYYQTQGYDTSPGKVKCALHPVQFQQLITSENIERYVQDGSPDRIRDGTIPSLFGIDLIPMLNIPAVNQTGTDTYRAVCFIPENTFFLASKRELTIDIQKRPRSSSYDWAWTQRKNATVFDSKSLVRISSVNPTQDGS